jgi:hypothetical protein
MRKICCRKRASTAAAKAAKQKQKNQPPEKIDLKERMTIL